MTYKLVCTNPETKQFTEPEVGIATKAEAERLRTQYALRETPRNGVLLVFTIEEEIGTRKD